MKKVFAISINYNRPDLTSRLLESLRNSKSGSFELDTIIVDNGTIEKYSLDKKFDDVVLIRPGTNTGFAGGMNIGIKNALEKNADYVLLINNDTVLDKRLIDNLFKAIESNEKFGIVSPKIYFEKGKESHKDRYNREDLGRVIWYAGGFMDWDNARSVHRGVDEVDHGQYDKAEKIDFATGCCMMIRADVLEDVGLFNERYFLYYEDADLCMRVRRARFDIYYEPKAFLYHENASSSGSGSPLHDYFLTRNQMIFGMGYAPFKTKIALIRQSLGLLFNGRKYQKKGIRDYYLRKFGMGSYFEK